MQFTPSATLPMLTLDGEPSDFDYGAFLQEEDVDYLAEDSSTSSHTLAESSPPPLTSQSNTSVVRSGSSSQPRQRLERRGHTKSRRGCFNCKRRRIKCQETRPACGHCVKTGLKCEYPAAPQVVHQPQHQIPLFSLQDMRFFQHFLFHCTPHHPIGTETIWTHEIPCLSEKYEYLMHAILGLAASDLTQRDPSLVASAMHHRVKAIKAIKKTLAEAPKANSFEEGNAMMATCFALTFQSVLLDDGMTEYMTFIRGVVIVAIQMYIKGANLIFADFLGDKQQEVLQPFIENMPLIERSWVDSAVVAVESLSPLCQHPIEQQYYEKILDMAKQLGVSSWGAYKAMTTQYGWWMMLPHDQFQRVIDTTNQVNILLSAHWIALKQIMAIITEKEYEAGARPQNATDGGVEPGMLRWLKYLNRLVDAEHKVYNQWPVWVETQLDRDPCFFGKTR
ncbi:C6 zinc finger protein [Phialemonium atrogriseum]|uniref:C6 zinc finger protein n=1 Tax=Phialemonium atrogriseum TaxID=1093897 RepID=A0AAJ0C992_9PEZI|nr:C6 zinc finger protein [Phialemonium atrogriseum]KAK1772523.1 C6 zinc finger protein [Phialemonium atrogriseum]